jgi:hypothetical protein
MIYDATIPILVTLYFDAIRKVLENSLTSIYCIVSMSSTPIFD